MVGKRVVGFPHEWAGFVRLRVLGCWRNLSPVCMVTAPEILRADHNALAWLSLSVGPRLTVLGFAWNDITGLAPAATSPPHEFAHAKLSLPDSDALRPFTERETLKLDHNAIRALLESLTRLTHLSRSNNQLDALPESGSTSTRTTARSRFCPACSGAARAWSRSTRAQTPNPDPAQLALPPPVQSRLQP
jgi:adenylate cyclase